MRRPPRPAPIVAAAVLLIVVASEMLLAGIAGVVLWLLNGGAAVVECCFAAILCLDLMLAGSFLSTAVMALRGTLLEPHREGNVITALGGMAALFSLLTMICCGWGLLTARPELDMNWLTQGGAIVVASLLLLWANTAALLTAGLLLRRNADRYLAWQRALRRPPEDAEHEE